MLIALNSFQLSIFLLNKTEICKEEQDLLIIIKALNNYLSIHISNYYLNRQIRHSIKNANCLLLNQL